MENFHTGGQDRDRPAAGLIEKWKSLNEMTALSQERKGEALGGWQVQSLSSRLSEMDRAGPGACLPFQAEKGLWPFRRWF